LSYTQESAEKSKLCTLMIKIPGNMLKLVSVCCSRLSRAARFCRFTGIGF
jgi:hypothetical protein